jgi:hypothetical protein
MLSAVSRAWAGAGSAPHGGGSPGRELRHTRLAEHLGPPLLPQATLQRQRERNDLWPIRIRAPPMPRTDRAYQAPPREAGGQKGKSWFQGSVLRFRPSAEPPCDRDGEAPIFP